MNGALPPHMIDLITDGVPLDDLRRKGHRAVYNAMVRTAASAQQRGWSRTRWEDLVEGRALGRQNKTDAGGRPVNPQSARRRLWKAWDSATEWLDDQDAPWPADAARQRVHDLADVLTATTLDETHDLTPSERTLLAAVAAIAAKCGSDRLTLSRAALIEVTGLGLTALRTALAGLDRRGAFVCVEAGAKRSKGKPRRANVYRLGTLNQSGNPVSGAPNDLAVPPSSVPSGFSGAPDRTTEETDDMNNITLSREQIVQALGEAALARLLDAREPDAEVRRLRAVGDGVGSG